MIKFAFEKVTQAAVWRINGIGQRKGVRIILNT